MSLRLQLDIEAFPRVEMTCCSLKTFHFDTIMKVQLNYLRLKIYSAIYCACGHTLFTCFGFTPRTFGWSKRTRPIGVDEELPTTAEKEFSP